MPHKFPGQRDAPRGNGSLGWGLLPACGEVRREGKAVGGVSAPGHVRQPRSGGGGTATVIAQGPQSEPA